MRKHRRANQCMVYFCYKNHATVANHVYAGYYTATRIYYHLQRQSRNRKQSSDIQHHCCNHLRNNVTYNTVLFNHRHSMRCNGECIPNNLHASKLTVHSDFYRQRVNQTVTQALHKFALLLYSVALLWSVV